MVGNTTTVNGQVYHLTFEDEFNGNDVSAWKGHGSNGKWQTSFSPHLDDTRFLNSNGEQQYYVDPDSALPNPFTQSGGILTINAIELTEEQQLQADGQLYASGILTTELTFGAKGGYVEISAQIPDQQGFLSAFWLLPADGDWSAEVDIFEVLGHDTTTLHTNVWDDGVSDEEAITVSDLSDGFHTYGLEWTETTITWYIDGVAVRTVDNTVDEPMYLALSLAVGTNWTGDTDATTDFSDGLMVDYVRVYENAETTTNAIIQNGDEFVSQVEYGGGAAGETLYGTRWADELFGGGGDDTLYGRKGGDTLDGGDGADTLQGQAGRDTLLGGAGNDKLIGGTGKDVLQGGAGTDHMWGGQWSADGKTDTFVFEDGCGKDFVHDFEAGKDLLDFSDFGATWGDVLGAMQDQGWATYINLSALSGNAEDKLFLVGVDASTLTQDDFLFGVGV